MFPSDWTVSTNPDKTAYTNTFTNGDFKIKSVVYTVHFGSTTAAAKRLQEMLSGYSNTGSDTSQNGVGYSYGIKGNKTSGYTKRVLKQIYRNGTEYVFFYIDASEMTENQLAWYDYIVSTLSKEMPAE